jgi:hypothetical protein
MNASGHLKLVRSIKNLLEARGSLATSAKTLKLNPVGAVRLAITMHA